VSAPLVALVPLVVATLEDGSKGYFYRGATIPSTVPAGEAKRLQDDGAIGTEKAADVPHLGSASAPKPGATVPELDPPAPAPAPKK
jgi:hypothetical protein